MAFSETTSCRQTLVDTTNRELVYASVDGTDGKRKVVQISNYVDRPWEIRVRVDPECDEAGGGSPAVPNNAGICVKEAVGQGTGVGGARRRWWYPTADGTAAGATHAKNKGKDGKVIGVLAGGEGTIKKVISAPRTVTGQQRYRRQEVHDCMG